jgi:hypothetical protein
MPSTLDHPLQATKTTSKPQVEGDSLREYEERVDAEIAAIHKARDARLKKEKGTLLTKLINAFPISIG